MPAVFSVICVTWLTFCYLFQAFNFTAVFIVGMLFMKIRERKLANFSVMGMESQPESQPEVRAWKQGKA